MTLTLAVTQMSCTWDRAANADRAEALVREAAAAGAGLVLLQELFETPYFCAAQKAGHYALAAPAEGHPLLARFAALARELGVVLPVSFFEAAGRRFFNSVAVIDADGRVLGQYRKAHVPQGPGYEEKFYFAPGDGPFRVWDTAAGRIGVGICWDQWFPEAARAMALAGADVLLYPTAIGSEPQDPSIHSLGHWRRVMQGHAGANMVALAASNRVGAEAEGPGLAFYGGSFVAGATGALLAEMGDAEGVALATIDLAAQARARDAWGLFRDRRPDLYAGLTA
jgi:N-carbamoylputrescine amidase